MPPYTIIEELSNLASSVSQFLQSYHRLARIVKNANVPVGRPLASYFARQNLCRGNVNVSG
jgi:hypothetical protein